MTNNIRWIKKIGAVLLLIGLLMVASRSSRAVFNSCEPFEECERPTHTPTLIPTPTPTDVPDGDPTPTPTDIPDGPTPTDAPPSGDNGGTGGPGPAGPPSCNVTTPQPPRLLKITFLGGGRVLVEWQKVPGATHYSINYGPTSGNYLHGVPNTGDVDNFIVHGVFGTCFIVRAINDCAPSAPSNELCTGVGQVLGLSTTSSGMMVNPLIFWAGLTGLMFGLKLVATELALKKK